MATLAPRRPAVALTASDKLRIPGWVVVTAACALLLALSLFIRTRQLGVPFWMDEGLSVGIAAHPLSALPGLMRQDGSPPLYYALLHGWMGAFGSSESATHTLSLLASLLCIPAAGWAARSLFDRRAGWIAAVLAALNPFLDIYAQETRMYALAALGGFLVAACFLQAFVYGRRRFAPAFGVSLAVLAYTHNWGLFLGVGAAIALVICHRLAPRAQRRALLRDGLIGFGVCAALYLPWLPTLLFQRAHTGAPWADKPGLGVPLVFSQTILGGGSATGLVLLAGGLGLWTIWRRDGRTASSAIGAALGERPAGPTGISVDAQDGAGRSEDQRDAVAPASPRDLADPERTAVIALLALGLGAIAVGWLVSQATPAFNPRYLAVVLGPTILLFALGLARAGRIGLVAVVLVAGLWINPGAHHINNKSNARQLAVDLNPYLRPGDLVIVGSPEQVSLFRYYLAPGVRFATALGATPDPGIMDWRDALKRLRAANVAQNLLGVLATVPAGQRVLFVRPVTQFLANWNAPWTKLVRRRSAQWGDALGRDPELVRVAAAPTFYRPESTNIAMHAVLYSKRPAATLPAASRLAR